MWIAVLPEPEFGCKTVVGRRPDLRSIRHHLAIEARGPLIFLMTLHALAVEYRLDQTRVAEGVRPVHIRREGKGSPLEGNGLGVGDGGRGGLLLVAAIARKPLARRLVRTSR